MREKGDTGGTCTSSSSTSSSSCCWRGITATNHHNTTVIVFVFSLILFTTFINLWNDTQQQQQQQTGINHLFYKSLSLTNNKNNNSTVRGATTRVGDTFDLFSSTNSTKSSISQNDKHGYLYSKIPKDNTNDNSTNNILNEIYKELLNIESKLVRQKFTINATINSTNTELQEQEQHGKQEEQLEKQQPQYGCSNYQYTNGSWIKNESSIQVSNSYFWKVYNGENVMNNNNKCKLEDFTKQKFCEKLNGRSIFFVGDSITGQYVEAMEELFTAQHKTAIQYIPKLTKNENKVIIGQRTSLICSEYYNNNSKDTNTTDTKSIKQSSYLTYVRNDFLLPTSFAGSLNGNIISPWIHLLSSHSILVINTGAHTRSLRQYETNLKDVKQTIINSNFTGHVFFRTTPRGHINCSNAIHTKPIEINPKKSLDSNKEYSQFFINFTSHSIADYYYNNYHYSDFLKYNTMVKAIMSSSSSMATATTTRPTSLLSMLSFSSMTGNSSIELSSSISKSLSNSALSYQKYQKYNKNMTTNVNANINAENIIWKVIDIAPILELRPDVHRCYKADWIHIDMNKQIVLQIFWKLLYNGLQGYI